MDCWSITDLCLSRKRRSWTLSVMELQRANSLFDVMARIQELASEICVNYSTTVQVALGLRSDISSWRLVWTCQVRWQNFVIMMHVEHWMKEWCFSGMWYSFTTWATLSRSCQNMCFGSTSVQKQEFSECFVSLMVLILCLYYAQASDFSWFCWCKMEGLGIVPWMRFGLWTWSNRSWDNTEAFWAGAKCCDFDKKVCQVVGTSPGRGQCL